ncbi:MAE_28990/MAE_18760 family HEPN-like nuclease [Dapis sp. BLCC M229]|uniref:MAE_28990/MAE_18760 family HEPN-like nuclease n=1 Tax=Dapis sp. BLCC M229 TaxID=3400188 RepID=UPI003CFB4C17
MFENLLEIVNININSIKSIIQTNDRLRKIVEEGIVDIQRPKDNQEIIELLKGVPNEKEWELYEHCAVVTRLYAIYERFVKELISTWLQYLPQLVENYLELDEKIQNTHREGVGRILLEFKKDRFKDLSENQVIRGLFYGTTNQNKNYELLPEAFLLHDQNLRKDILEKLFTDAGIGNTWQWVVKHRKIRNFIEEIRGNQNTAEGELNQLISYRNEAAHGVVDQILGTQELLDLGDFIKALCQALAELVTYQIIQLQTATGKAKEIGEITEWFKEPKAAVAKINNSNLSIGTNVFLVSETSSYCRLAKIESIQLDKIPKKSIEIISETEVGLKFDIDAKKGLKIYIIVEDSGE